MLGKKVVLCNIGWSIKFLTFPYELPIYDHKEGLQPALDRAKSYPNALLDQRSKNINFYNKMKQLEREHFLG